MNSQHTTHPIQYPLERAEVVNLLQSYKITPTRQRIEIAGFLFQRPQHLSADRILEGVNIAGARVSRATVYNTMGLFAEKGLVREVLIDRERVFYDSNNSEHHHLYNESTGELRDLSALQVELGGVAELAEDMTIVGTDVIIRVASK